jgi:hypothetical protein
VGPLRRHGVVKTHDEPAAWVSVLEESGSPARPDATEERLQALADGMFAIISTIPGERDRGDEYRLRSC